MSSRSTPSVRAYAAQVVALTAAAWRVAPASPRARARRAPHGYVPVRVLRRLQRTAAAAFPAHRAVLAHSW
ncbi:hypothetical protein [Xylophilus sp. Leaf220]|uniref:hypothetical protein n=1 Tax=Xylophilus sp. Leaf220 TaxID=1735686 RepID=UPI0012E2D887|nr:hypothetical protein [Xylophilus sp. Leaf220]